MSETDRQIDETPLGRRLLVALLVPVVLLLAAGAVLGAQVSRMGEDARWVEHSDEVHRQDLRGAEADHRPGDGPPRPARDRGTGLSRAVREGRAARGCSSELRALVADSPAQQDRVDEVRRATRCGSRETADLAKGKGARRGRVDRQHARAQGADGRDPRGRRRPADGRDGPPASADRGGRRVRRRPRAGRSWASCWRSRACSRSSRGGR